MFIKTNGKEHLKGIYNCDRCQSELTSINRYGIFVAVGAAASRKKWDLCSSCYRKLCKGIAKGEKKEVKNNE